MKIPTIVFCVVGFMLLSYARRNNIHPLNLKYDTNIRMTNHDNIKVVLSRPMTPAELSVWKKDSMYFSQGPFIFRVIKDTAWKQ
jgi:hypothetical protein